jgi:hypothetical protein
MDIPNDITQERPSARIKYVYVQLDLLVCGSLPNCRQ